MPKAQPAAPKTRYHWDDFKVAKLVTAAAKGEDVYAAVPDAPREAVDAKLIALGLREKPKKPVLSDGDRVDVRNTVRAAVDRLEQVYGDCAPLALRYAHTLLGEHIPRRPRSGKGEPA